MGWDSKPCSGTYYKDQWLLNPTYLKNSLNKARAYIHNHSGSHHSDNILFIDNWNEDGEGDFVSQIVQFGFAWECFSIGHDLKWDILTENSGLRSD